jgi:hypothetical protein
MLRSVRVTVDSRDRNLAAYPDPAQYEWPMPEALRNVAAVRLVGMDVPLSAPLVSRAAAAFTFQWAGGAEAPAAFAHGDYAAPADLAAALQAALQLAIPAGTFAVAVDARAQTLAVQASDELVLRFHESAAPILGLRSDAPTLAAVAVSPGVWRAAAPYPLNLDGERYTALHLSPNSDALLAGLESGAHRGFAVIPITIHHGRRAAAPPFKYVIAEKLWSPNIARIARLGIKFMDYSGAPYDFRNKDHRLDFVFTINEGQPVV